MFSDTKSLFYANLISVTLLIIATIDKGKPFEKGKIIIKEKTPLYSQSTSDQNGFLFVLDFSTETKLLRTKLLNVP